MDCLVATASIGLSKPSRLDGGTFRSWASPQQEQLSKIPQRIEKKFASGSGRWFATAV